MAKKKKSSAAAGAAAGKAQPVPEVTAQDLEKARALLSARTADVSYGNAKALFAKEFGWSRSLANEVVVALYKEDFLGGVRNMFCVPGAPVTTAVVRGARDRSEFTIPDPDDPENGLHFEFLNLLPGDTVEMRRDSRHWYTTGRLLRRQRKWVCTVGQYKNVAVPLNPFAPVEFDLDPEQVPADLSLDGKAVEVELTDEAMQETSNWAPLHARFVRVVGQRFDPLGEIAIAAAQYDLPVEFSPEALAEAEALPDEVDSRSMAHRVDLRDIPFVTIDGEDARDFDDAVYCCRLENGQYRLLVAIADVSHYVKPEHALDVDAQRRATSVYFPASVVPMLPEKLSNGLCSLNPNVDRLTMVCDAVISEKGETLAYQFYPAVIHSHARLTYTQVWSALQGERSGVEFLGDRLEDVQVLYELYGVLRKARAARHTLDFETKETQAVFDEDGHISGFRVRDHNDAHRLIEECMLVANVCAADFVLLKKRDTLFRVHDQPAPDRLNTLRAVLRSFGIRLTDTTPEGLAELVEQTRDNEFLQSSILRSMSRACYTPQNIGHYGLQYAAYAHFTSPIRRYPDLLLHRTIKGILSRRVYTPKVVFDDASVMEGRHARGLGGKPDNAKPSDAPVGAKEAAAQARLNAWTRLGVICSAAERRADDATRDVMNYLKCDYMLKQKEKRYEATVTGMIPAGIFVTLNDLAIDGFVHISNLGWGYWNFDQENLVMSSDEEMQRICMGDPVEVAVEDIDLENRRLSFVLVGNRSRRRGHSSPGGRKAQRGSRQGWRR